MIVIFSFWLSLFKKKADMVVVVTIYSFQSITQSFERVFEKIDINSKYPNNSTP